MMYILSAALVLGADDNVGEDEEEAEVPGGLLVSRDLHHEPRLHQLTAVHVLQHRGGNLVPY